MASFIRSRRRFLYLLLMLAVAGAAIVPSMGQGPPAATLGIQLYTLDGGRLYFKDMGAFSDTGERAGQPGTMAVSCYLIHHGKDWLLWDTGLGDRIAGLPDGEVKFGGRFTVRRTLGAQLTELGLKPDDIHYVALSHLHSDHCGNIGLFPGATFLVANVELAWARALPTPDGVELPLIRPLAQARIEATDEDKDVFGDGSVRILKAPGHTPGHRILLVKLAKAGTLLISGDLYHTRLDYKKGLIPVGNVSRADTMASFDRFARIKANTRARVIIEHAPEDFAMMPAFPKYLE